MPSIDLLYAKSPVPGGETLVEHTLQVVLRIGQLSKRLPSLPVDLALPDLWSIMFWSAIFHDFGKAASGFQAMLRGGNPWGFRHEILSLAFLEWVFKPESQAYMIATSVIASHHRDFHVIYKMYLRHPMDSGIDERWSEEMDSWRIEALAEWIIQEASSLADNIGIELTLHPHANIFSDNLRISGPKKIRKALQSYQNYVERQQIHRLRNNEQIYTYRHEGLCLRGLMLQADRLASAGAPPLKQPNLYGVAQEFERKGRSLYYHQIVSASTIGNVLLAAPTGSGKTEAALLWICKQQQEQRPGAVFYILPYQASINAMYHRFHKRYHVPKHDIALMHSRAVQALYRDLVNEHYGTVQEATNTAKKSKSFAKLHQQPICIATPYQLLRAAFRLPGYEGQWVMMRGSHIIVDEIHGYEPERLGLLLEFFAVLRRDWNVRFYCMTATMPGWLKDIVIETIDISHTIQADIKLFQQFRRHKITLKNGNLLDSDILDAIAKQVQAGQCILVVANLVNTATQIAEELRLRLSNHEQYRGFDPNTNEVLLLHSRFNGEDRLLLETQLIERITNEKRKPFVLVATQVVEVSLDVDFDTIYTEPAPLEALLQRFGRVNRQRKYASLPVHIMREAIDWQFPYNAEELLRRTIALLERYDGENIDESLVSTWLDELYEPLMPSLLDKIAEGRQHFHNICGKDNLIAFDSDPSISEQFDALFDGHEILPAPKYEEFVTRMHEGKVIEAYGLLVPISSRQYGSLIGRDLIKWEPTYHVRLAYCQYTSSEGLLVNEPVQQDVKLI